MRREFGKRRVPPPDPPPQAGEERRALRGEASLQLPHRVGELIDAAFEAVVERERLAVGEGEELA